MGTQERRERHRADRHRAILGAARELAEESGWDAVTTRRLAERIEYSQPVLYSHFPAGKEEIVAAVALDGFAELAATLRRAAAAGDAPRAYLAFARDHPAVYEAMFSARTGLSFAADDTPAVLHEGFAALRDAVRGGSDRASPDDDLLVELVWAALHGIAVLTRAGRLPAESADARLARLTELIARPTG